MAKAHKVPFHMMQIVFILFGYSYHSLYSTIVGSGLFNSSMSLGFLQAVLQILDQNASFVENSEMLWRFWSAVVQPLLEHITKVGRDFIS